MPHHITQRGNRQMAVFGNEADHRAYLHLLHQYAQRDCVQIWAYCLMPNHIHVVAVPQTDSGLSSMLRDTHQRYAAEFNSRSKTSGHLWQGRYYSCVLDEAHAYHAVRYIELNPVRAGLARAAEDYPWSSAAGHSGLRVDPVLDDAPLLAEFTDDWRDWLARGAEDQAAIDALRRSTTTGRPCGSADFVARIGEATGRDLRKRRPGPRPRIE